MTMGSTHKSPAAVAEAFSSIRTSDAPLPVSVAMAVAAAAAADDERLETAAETEAGRIAAAVGSAPAENDRGSSRGET